MDSLYQKLAPKYYATRFIRVFVENMPWLVEKLAIKVLPCLMCFIDGVSKDRYVFWVLVNVIQSFIYYQPYWVRRTRE